MRFLGPVGLGLILLAGVTCASAAELAVLKNGSSIPFIRKEQSGNVTRLYVPGGHMDIPSEEIVSYEKDDSPLPDATPATQTTPSQTTVTQAAPIQPTVSVPTQASTAATAPQPATVSMPVAASSSSRTDIDQLVREASSRHQLDPDFVASVIRAESNYNPHAVSRKGAQGLMQLMPQTAAGLGVKNAFDPQANVEAGTAHLSALLDMYHNDPIKALAAYNAGAHRVQQYHGVPPYRETRAYVAKIVRDFNAKKRAQMKAGTLTAGKSPNSSQVAGKATQSRKTAKKPVKAQPQQASVTNQNGPA